MLQNYGQVQFKQAGSVVPLYRGVSPLQAVDPRIVASLDNAVGLPASEAGQKVLLRSAELQAPIFSGENHRRYTIDETGGGAQVVPQWFPQAVGIPLDRSRGLVVPALNTIAMTPTRWVAAQPSDQYRYVRAAGRFVEVQRAC